MEITIFIDTLHYNVKFLCGGTGNSDIGTDSTNRRSMYSWSGKMSVRMRKNEEYKEKYLKILRDRIERVFNYEEEDISVQMEVAEKSTPYK